MYIHRNGNSAIIMRSATTGMRYVRVTSRGKKVYTIPLDIAALTVGSDRWLRDVVCKCQYCEKDTTVGHNDQPGVCQRCSDESYEENAKMDAVVVD